jgi:hypothetical protein
MPEQKRPANGGQRRPPHPTRKPQQRRTRQRPPRPGPPVRNYGPVYLDPPIRNSPPALSGVIGGIGIVGIIALVVFLVGGMGGSDDGGKSNNADGKLPSVSIEGAMPCVQSNSERINLNTPARLEACKSAKLYTKQLLVQKHGKPEGEKQFGCQDKLWDHESKWSPWAINTDSGAYGLAQILPSSHGSPVEMGDWKGQVKWGMDYVWGRYQTSCNAWEFWQCTSNCSRYPGGPVGKLGGPGDPRTTWY